jgi:hypothetical protein
MAAASKDELKRLRLLGRSGFNATGVKPTSSASASEKAAART